MDNGHSMYCHKPDIFEYSYAVPTVLNISVKIFWPKVWATVSTNPNLAKVVKADSKKLI